MTLDSAPAHPVIELDDVTFRRADHTILKSVSFAVHPGEHWALIGPNGAGKSTLLGLCGALIHPTSGTVRVLGQQLGRVELQALRRLIGHVNPRHPLTSPLTVIEVVLTGLTGSVQTPPRWQPDRNERIRAVELIEVVGLAGKHHDRWPALSQGERSRALIARALICNPHLLLLDEPTTGLDVAAREHFLATFGALKKANAALSSIHVTHHLEELPTGTTHAALLDKGNVTISGPARGVLNSTNVSRTFAFPWRSPITTAGGQPPQSPPQTSFVITR